MSRQKPRTLTDWEWTTLVAAWRYYEHRHTIASAEFPEAIVKLFWDEDGMAEYEDSVRNRIASQFANVDHGLRGAADWPSTDPFDYMNGNIWRKFYAFCKAWTDDAFEHLTVSNGEKTEVVACFRANGRVYPRDEYIARPWSHCWVPDEYIQGGAE